MRHDGGRLCGRRGWDERRGRRRQTDDRMGPRIACRVKHVELVLVAHAVVDAQVDETGARAVVHAAPGLTVDTRGPPHLDGDRVRAGLPAQGHAPVAARCDDARQQRRRGVVLEREVPGRDVAGLVTARRDDRGSRAIRTAVGHRRATVYERERVRSGDVPLHRADVPAAAAGRSLGGGVGDHRARAVVVEPEAGWSGYVPRLVTADTGDRCCAAVRPAIGLGRACVDPRGLVRALEGDGDRAVVPAIRVGRAARNGVRERRRSRVVLERMGVRGADVACGVRARAGHRGGRGVGPGIGALRAAEETRGRVGAAELEFDWAVVPTRAVGLLVRRHAGDGRCGGVVFERVPAGGADVAGLVGAGAGQRGGRVVGAGVGRGRARVDA